MGRLSAQRLAAAGAQVAILDVNKAGPARDEGRRSPACTRFPSTSPMPRGVGDRAPDRDRARPDRPRDERRRDHADRADRQPGRRSREPRDGDQLRRHRERSRWPCCRDARARLRRPRQLRLGGGLAAHAPLRRVQRLEVRRGGVHRGAPPRTAAAACASRACAATVATPLLDQAKSQPKILAELPPIAPERVLDAIDATSSAGNSWSPGSQRRVRGLGAAPLPAPDVVERAPDRGPGAQGAAASASARSARSVRAART